MKILIAGVGYVGTALLRTLAPHHEVWGIRRTRHEGDGSQILIANAETGDGLDALPGDIRQIAVAISPGARTDDAYKGAYPGVIRTLTRAFPSARLLLVSSSTVYAQSEGETITEETPAESTSFSAARIREAEALVLGHGNRSAVVRASGIYGPGRVRLMSRLLAEAPASDEAQALTNRIHRDDLAEALAFLIERPELDGIFLGSDETPATLTEMHLWLAAHPLRGRLPGSSTGIGTRGPRSSRRLIPKRLLEAGFKFNFPSFREGYDAILEDLPGASRWIAHEWK